MNRIAEELDAKLNALDPEKAKALVLLVQNAMEQVDQSGADWPDGYFDKIAGSFADEPLERATQGEATTRES
ncbi:hypothetical protein [Planctomycetes bacterium K23_9]|uniref:Uncharacterized protein n=1 Tax=Stieleria marina TaxID=1930275 RepID=A0A517NXH8_9BACT|nr:hypothetical protein K239x_38310 [Planctomycetes bacterium K23_9]